MFHEIRLNRFRASAEVTGGSLAIESPRADAVDDSVPPLPYRGRRRSAARATPSGPPLSGAHPHLKANFISGCRPPISAADIV
jgi:hypothetical protein